MNSLQKKWPQHNTIKPWHKTKWTVTQNKTQNCLFLNRYGHSCKSFFPYIFLFFLSLSNRLNLIYTVSRFRPPKMPDHFMLLFAQCLLWRAMLKLTLKLTVMSLGSFLDWLYFCFAVAVAAVSCRSSAGTELWLRQTANQILTWASSSSTRSWCHLLKGQCPLWLILSFV